MASPVLHERDRAAPTNWEYRKLIVEYILQLFSKMRLLPALFLVWTAAWPVYSQPYTISPFAGGGLPVNLPGTSANLLAVGPVAVDASGNLFFVGASDAVVRC